MPVGSNLAADIRGSPNTIHYALFFRVSKKGAAMNPGPGTYRLTASNGLSSQFRIDPSSQFAEATFGIFDWVAPPGIYDHQTLDISIKFLPGDKFVAIENAGQPNEKTHHGTYAPV